MHEDGVHATTSNLETLPLAGATLAIATAEPYATTLVFDTADGTRLSIRIESTATVWTPDGSRTELEAGPALGAAMSALVGQTAQGFSVDDLDLILSFGELDEVRIHADDTGYESYVIRTGEQVIAALPPSGPVGSSARVIRPFLNPEDFGVPGMLLRNFGPFSRVGSIVNVLFSTGILVMGAVTSTSDNRMPPGFLIVGVVLVAVFVAIAVYVWVRSFRGSSPSE